MPRPLRALQDRSSMLALNRHVVAFPRTVDPDTDASNLLSRRDLKPRSLFHGAFPYPSFEFLSQTPYFPILFDVEKVQNVGTPYLIFGALLHANLFSLN